MHLTLSQRLKIVECSAQATGSTLCGKAARYTILDLIKADVPRVTVELWDHVGQDFDEAFANGLEKQELKVSI